MEKRPGSLWPCSRTTHCMAGISVLICLTGHGLLGNELQEGFNLCKGNKEKCATLVWCCTFVYKTLLEKVQKLEEQKDDPENNASALDNSNDLLKRNSENCPPRLWYGAEKCTESSGGAGLPRSGSGCQVKRAMFSISKVTAAMCSWLGPGTLSLGTGTSDLPFFSPPRTRGFVLQKGAVPYHNH